MRMSTVHELPGVVQSHHVGHRTVALCPAAVVTLTVGGTASPASLRTAELGNGHIDGNTEPSSCAPSRSADGGGGSKQAARASAMIAAGIVLMRAVCRRARGARRQ